MVFLKNCEPQFLYILAELFNMCLKESCFPDCRMVSSVVPVKNVVKRYTSKSYHPVSLLSVVSKVSKKMRKNVAFLISSMVLGLLDQLQIF